MFPLMVTPSGLELIDQYGGQAVGWKVSGAGGGGYLILVAERPLPSCAAPCCTARCGRNRLFTDDR